MKDRSTADLRPLGTLAPMGRERWSGATLDRSEEMPADLRARVSDYLAGCPVFLAWMEYTRDELEDRFGVSGGSAIASDGLYYWRLDAVEYIKEYGIPVPAEAIAHFQKASWTPPTLDRDAYIEIYQELDERLGGGEVVA